MIPLVEATMTERGQVLVSIAVSTVIRFETANCATIPPFSSARPLSRPRTCDPSRQKPRWVCLVLTDGAPILGGFGTVCEASGGQESGQIGRASGGRHERERAGKSLGEEPRGPALPRFLTTQSITWYSALEWHAHENSTQTEPWTGPCAFFGSMAITPHLFKT
jgi:hypothetical protein